MHHKHHGDGPAARWQDHRRHRHETRAMQQGGEADSDSKGSGLLLTAIGLAAVAGGAYAATRAATATGRGNDDDAPGRTARRQRFGDYAVVGNTVTINRARADLYAQWRDFQNLPLFMENVEAVEPLEGDRSRWIIEAPGGGTVSVITEIAQDRTDEIIAWRSVEGSDINTEGRVHFRDAPEGRGTYVELIIAYKPPFGVVGQAVAKLMRIEPAIQARRDLRRFKMLMEAGEIATAANRKQDNTGATA